MLSKYPNPMAYLTAAGSSSASMAFSGKRPVDFSTETTSDIIKRRRSQGKDAKLREEEVHAAAQPHLLPSTASVVQEGDGTDSDEVRLQGLLLRCAECVAMDNLDAAGQLVPEIAELSSPFGSSAQRVGAYFADALSARIVSSYLGSYSPFVAPDWKSNHQKLQTAVQTYNSVTPLIKFSHFTANQAIQQAVDGAEHVHVIDLDIMQGLQWPGFFQILASKPRKLKSFRITGLGPSAEILNSTGQRLAELATALSIPFQFQALEGKIGNLKDVNQLNIRIGETVVVHLMHHCLYDITGCDSGALRMMKLIRPKLITIVEQDMTHGGSFLGRFVGALHYYSALFDALGDGLTAESMERHAVEQQVFGREIRNILAVNLPNRTAEGKVERWWKELALSEFRPVSLIGNPAAQATLLLEMYPWRGYTLLEENGSLKLGWKDLSLLTASAWQNITLDSLL